MSFAWTLTGEIQALSIFLVLSKPVGTYRNLVKKKPN